MFGNGFWLIFIPNVIDRVQNWALCRSVKFFHIRPIKTYLQTSTCVYCHVGSFKVRSVSICHKFGIYKIVSENLGFVFTKFIEIIAGDVHILLPVF